MTLSPTAQQQAVRLLQEIVGIPSVTGDEERLAKYLADRLRAAGAASVDLIDSETGRFNVVAAFGPESVGDELVLVAHLDTVTVAGWREWWETHHPGDERADPFAGVVAEDCLWARGASDVKGGIATVVAALEYLQGSGAGLRKRVVVAFVSDEESGEPGMGTSAGIKAALPAIRAMAVSPALAIYLEPTTLQVYTTQMGFQIADIVVEGRTAYFGRPELGVDALAVTHDVLAALWRHNDAIHEHPADELLGEPNLLVTSITGGGPIAVPGECRLSLIRKVLPDESMDDAMRGIQAAVASVALPEGASVSVTFSAARDHEAGGTAVKHDRDQPRIRKFVELVELRRPDRAGAAGAPYWSESPLIEAALQAPCIYWAAGDISVCHTPQERIELADYFDAVGILAEFLITPWDGDH